MYRYAVKNGYGKHPTANLVASYFGKAITISSQLAALYIRLGFVISNVTQVSLLPGIAFFKKKGGAFFLLNKKPPD